MSGKCLAHQVHLLRNLIPENFGKEYEPGMDEKDSEEVFDQKYIFLKTLMYDEELQELGNKPGWMWLKVRHDKDTNTTKDSKGSKDTEDSKDTKKKN